MAFKKQGSKARDASGRMAGFSAPSGFGSLAASSTTASSLSYLSDAPDLSTISDSNVIVSFKNLLKKDDTTKSKGLGDLISYTQAHPNEQDGGVEDAILDAWVQMYPRISIENDRRIRDQSHKLQYELLKSARKRMEKNLPKVAGAWLAGTFDADKTVARTATQGLVTFLNTEEKVLLFWKKCQVPLLQYAKEAITETPNTLSDARSVKPEDAEAKFYRVISASFSLVVGLLRKLSRSDTEKYDYDYETFFASALGDQASTFVTADDPRVRKRVYELLLLSLEHRQELLQPHLSSIRKVLTSDALKRSQTGSAVDLVAVLTQMTQYDSEFWGTKKSPYAKLRPLVEKGSQFGSPSFWEGLDKLLSILSSDSITSDTVSEFLKSLRTGISRRDEPRSNASTAWACYLNATSRLLQHFDTVTRANLLTENIFPMTEHFLLSEDRRGEWSVGVDASILCKAYKVAAVPTDEGLRQALAKEWNRLAEVLITRLSNSLPEVSKEFETSQKKIAEDAKRWFSAVTAISKSLSVSISQSKSNVPNYTVDPTCSLIRSAADLLRRRNFKPFGAATVLLTALQQTPQLFEPPLSGSWSSLVPLQSDEDMATLLSSPSAEIIISSIVFSLQTGLTGAKSEWGSVMQLLLRQSQTPKTAGLVAKMISTAAAKPLARDMAELQDYLENSLISTAQSGARSLGLFEATLQWDALNTPGLQKVASSAVQGLDGDAVSSLRAIEGLVKRQPTIFSEDETLHLTLVTKLLTMMEIGNSATASQARQLHGLLSGQASDQPSVLTIVHDNLERPGPNSLGIDTLVQQAITVFESSQDDVEQIYPNTNIWMQELLQFLEGELSPSLALTSTFGGTYFLPQGNGRKAEILHKRDQKGLSVPARMGFYTTALLDNGASLEALPKRFQAEILYLLYLVAEVSSDQMALMNQDGLFSTLSDPKLFTEVEDFVASTRKVIKDIFAQNSQWRAGKGDDMLDELVSIMMQQAKSTTAIGVYSARALSEVLESFADAHAYGNLAEEWIASLDILKVTPETVLPLVAILTGFGEILVNSKSVSNLLNRVISDIAGAKPEAEKTLLLLIVLNACMPIFELGELPVANNRLVFAVKQITSWFEESPDEVGAAISTESCRALQRLLPCIREVYGPYWRRTLEYCITLWLDAAKDDEEQRLPYIYTSVKLLSSMRAMDEPNDDLTDALISLAEPIYHGLLELLKIPVSALSQPQRLVHELLCRETIKIPTSYFRHVSDIYSLMASESKDIQTAGFLIIDRVLPAAQEQISIDAVLDKKQAKLPDELTSLLLDAPTLEAYPEELLVQFPAPIRTYLLSWKLIFDAIGSAAYKVRGDYTDALKAEGVLAQLMEFMFDVLGHSAGNPINIDREGLTADDIEDYDIQVADQMLEERDMHWLLIHLFYKTLRYAPGLFKSWFLDCRSRQTKIAIEPWMKKYFSPIIITHALSEVEEWAKKQEVTEEGEKELIIKVNYGQAEVTAAYPFDDDGEDHNATILIKAKPTYPLDSVEVVGVTRLGCSERKWQSWLRITHGIVTMSNGAFVDGLTAFRRNVLGALRGHSECAICYSLVAVDKKMPDKKCPQCKNVFHANCLHKWFASSGQSTCPLCRTRMDFAAGKKKSSLVTGRNDHN